MISIYDGSMLFYFLYKVGKGKKLKHYVIILGPYKQIAEVKPQSAIKLITLRLVTSSKYFGKHCTIFLAYQLNAFI